MSERVDSNPFRDVDQGIEEIEHNECYGERIEESKWDGEDDGEEDALEEVDGDEHESRDHKLCRPYLGAYEDAEECNQSEGIDHQISIGSWLTQVKEVRHILRLHAEVELLHCVNEFIHHFPVFFVVHLVVFYNLCCIRLDSEDAAKYSQYCNHHAGSRY